MEAQKEESFRSSCPVRKTGKFRGQRSSFRRLKVEAVDPTGAGDILAGAFWAFLYRGKSPEEALEKA
ncbi:MAG TPA: hypothetical protein EYP81_00540, partial [Thermodesulfobacteriaceae bacterium]|nr:hypothetical protein [Thermodesulfobacteriaceae bacterium]